MSFSLHTSQCGTSAPRRRATPRRGRRQWERGRGSCDRVEFETAAAGRRRRRRRRRGPAESRGSAEEEHEKNQQKKHILGSICISNWADIQKKLLMCVLLSRSFHLCSLRVSGFYAPPPTLIWVWMICLSFTLVLFPPFLRAIPCFLLLTIVTSCFSCELLHCPSSKPPSWSQGSAS